jgi:electron transfer flavoprotein alpha subunit
LILADGNDILMSDACLSKLAEQKEALKARLIELLQETENISYLDLNQELLNQVLDRHFDQILAALKTGSLDELMTDVSARARARAEEPNFELRHMVAFYLLTRRVFREKVYETLPQEERYPAMTKVAVVMDTATMVAADVFSSSRQATILRQQTELANMASIVREEIDALDRNIAKTAANIEGLNLELKELKLIKMRSSTKWWPHGSSYNR